MRISAPYPDISSSL